MRFVAKFLACISLVVGMPLLSHAAEPWPVNNRTIVLINPFAPGGASDAFSRPVAKSLTTQLGVPVIVDNKSGAGGTLGAAYAAKMPPDGYGWFAGAVHHTIAQSLYPNLSYDITKDFEPIAILGSTCTEPYHLLTCLSSIIEWSI